jgi:16S rRNA (uracil1498-N3)-methyltransferase
MKEIRFFYAPAGDEIRLTDGKGMFYKAEITTATGKRCLFKVLEAVSHPKEWSGHLHLALAPTKNMDRIEWLAEKATEIGFDELTFLDCRYSERKVVKTERIDKILVSAMKQSHKARKPLLNEMEDFKRFVARPFAGQKFIAHCYDEADVAGVAKASEDKAMDGGKPFLLDELDAGQDALVLVGPEGDFSIDEVRLAQAHGFRSVSLGRSRLRTETAALVAVHLMHIRHARM